MWQPETCPIVYAMDSRTKPNARATPKMPILLTAMIALPGPTIMSTAVPTASAVKTRMFDCPVGDGVSFVADRAAMAHLPPSAHPPWIAPLAKGPEPGTPSHPHRAEASIRG